MPIIGPCAIRSEVLYANAKSGEGPQKSKGRTTNKTTSLLTGSRLPASVTPRALSRHHAGRAAISLVGMGRTQAGHFLRIVAWDQPEGVRDGDPIGIDYAAQEVVTAYSIATQRVVKD